MRTHLLINTGMGYIGNQVKRDESAIWCHPSLSLRMTSGENYHDDKGLFSMAAMFWPTLTGLLNE